MRRRRGSKFTVKRWLLLAAVILALTLLAVAVIDLSSDTSFFRDPVYLPHGDVFFVPRD